MNKKYIRKKELVVKAWAVMFSPALIEKRTAIDNPGKVMTSLCIFDSKKQAINWINEKWVGGYYKDNTGQITIKKCEVNIVGQSNH